MKHLFALTVALALAGCSALAVTNEAPESSPLLDVNGLPPGTALLPSFELLSVDALINSPRATGVKPLMQIGGFAWISLPTDDGHPILGSPGILCSNGHQHPFVQVGTTWFTSSNLCCSGDTLQVLYCSNTNNPGTNLVPMLNVYYGSNTHSYQPRNWWTGLPAMQTYQAVYAWTATNPAWRPGP